MDDKYEGQKQYPPVFELDGTYVRVNRYGKWVNRCFEQELERLFDGMVDHCYDNEMVELYNTLCGAATERFPQLVQDYIRFYKELWYEG